MAKADLRLDWCSYEAAKYAVEHWHYSRVMPTPPYIFVGVWEGGQYIGVVVFSRGVNNNLSKPYGLGITEVCELTRVALREHVTPVSRILKIATRMIANKESELRLIISFADTNKGHHGGIYQAAGWIYSGRSHSTPQYWHRGKKLEQRQVSRTGVKRQYGRLRAVPTPSQCDIVPQLDKHRYLYPLDAAMRAQIAPLAKPYPKREPRGTGETDSAPQSNAETGGASPTVPLSNVTHAKAKRKQRQ